MFQATKQQTLLLSHNEYVAVYNDEIDLRHVIETNGIPDKYYTTSSKIMHPSYLETNDSAAFSFFSGQKPNNTPVLEVSKNSALDASHHLPFKISDWIRTYPASVASTPNLQEVQFVNSNITKNSNNPAIFKSFSPLNCNIIINKDRNNFSEWCDPREQNRMAFSVLNEEMLLHLPRNSFSNYRGQNWGVNDNQQCDEFLIKRSGKFEIHEQTKTSSGADEVKNRLDLAQHSNSHPYLSKEISQTAQDLATTSSRQNITNNPSTFYIMESERQSLHPNKFQQSCKDAIVSSINSPEKEQQSFSGIKCNGLPQIMRGTLIQQRENNKIFSDTHPNTECQPKVSCDLSNFKSESMNNRYDEGIHNISLPPNMEWTLNYNNIGSTDGDGIQCQDKNIHEIVDSVSIVLEAHSTAIWNSKLLYKVFSKWSKMRNASTKNILAACLVIGGIVSGNPLLLKEKICRKYNLKTYLPLVHKYLCDQRPEIPWDLPPYVYVKIVGKNVKIQEQDISSVEKLTTLIDENEFEEPGMAQQWAIATVLQYLKMSKSPHYISSFNSLKLYMRTQRHVFYLMNHLKNRVQ